jgi:predicted enzyme related to lactoylglutathione lyase
MAKLDHLSIQVQDAAVSRDWYMEHFGFTLEFEIPERGIVALQDEAGLTLFLEAVADGRKVPSCTLFLQVDDVEAVYRALSAKGVNFDKPPQKLFWGYGAELLDPSGYRIGLWDERSMRARY